MYVCDPFDFKNFGVGVYKNQTACPEIQYTHTSVVVGYGKNENNDEYWEILNSYGEEWGDSGTIRLARNTEWDQYGGQNGILHKPAYNIPKVYLSANDQYSNDIKKPYFYDQELGCRALVAKTAYEKRLVYRELNQREYVLSE